MSDKSRVLKILCDVQRECEEIFVGIFKERMTGVFKTTHLTYKDFIITEHNDKDQLSFAMVALKPENRYKVFGPIAIYSLGEYKQLVKRWSMARRNIILLQEDIKTVDEILLERLRND